MTRSTALFAAVLLASTCLAGSANAGWFSSPDKQTEAQKTDAANKAMPQANLDNDIRQAQLARTSGDLTTATHSLAQMMLVYPDDPRVVGEYGKVLTQQGRSQDAVSFLKRATDLQPGDWTLYSALGVAYDQMGDTNNARSAYERALQLKPGNVVVFNNYGLSRAAAGDLDGAQRMLAQANAVPNGDPKIARNAVMVAALQPPHSAPAQTFVAAASSKPVARRSAPTTTVVAYVPPAAKPLPANVMMQKVPVDSKAGPVAVAKAEPRATRAPRQLIAEAKPAKPAAAKKDATPALRMTADASAP